MLSREEQERNQERFSVPFSISLAVLPLMFSVRICWDFCKGLSSGEDEPLSLSKQPNILFLIESIWSHTDKTEHFWKYAGHRWARARLKQLPGPRAEFRTWAVSRCAVPVSRCAVPAGTHAVWLHTVWLQVHISNSTFWVVRERI